MLRNEVLTPDEGLDLVPDLARITFKAIRYAKRGQQAAGPVPADARKRWTKEERRELAEDLLELAHKILEHVRD